MRRLVPSLAGLVRGPPRLPRVAGLPRLLPMPTSSSADISSSGAAGSSCVSRAANCASSVHTAGRRRKRAVSHTRGQPHARSATRAVSHTRGQPHIARRVGSGVGPVGGWAVRLEPAVSRWLHGVYSVVARRLLGGCTAVTRRLHGVYSVIARWFDSSRRTRSAAGRGGDGVQR